MTAKGTASGRAWAIISIVLALVYALIAWMAWQDIAINLYQYHNPDAVTVMHWAAMLLPAISAPIMILVAMMAFRGKKAWQLWAILILLGLNIVLPILQMELFFSGFSGGSWG
jgi:mannose/fructose/N-acetylgalactosamine-specific phosphotransferase system component IID